jgi:hypothetical protein
MKLLVINPMIQSNEFMRTLARYGFVEWKVVTKELVKLYVKPYQYDQLSRLVK